MSSDLCGGASALLPVATSLEAFLGASRSVRAAAPGAASGPVPGSGPGVVAFAPGDLADYVGRATEVMSRTPASNLLNALETMDVTQQSMGYAAVLASLLRHPPSNLPDWDSLHSRLVVFIDEADPQQLRLAPATTADICHYLPDELARKRVF